MKKVLMALTVLGTMHFSAEAQTNSKYNQNYKMCNNAHGYYVCGEEAPKVAGTKVTKEGPDASLRMMDTYVHLGYSRSEGQSNKRNPRIRVSYDDPTAPYKGQESMINDGVKKNINRNINYLDNSVQLPAVDGGN